MLATTHYMPVSKELALCYENVIKELQAYTGPHRHFHVSR